MINPLCMTCGNEYDIDPETSLYFCRDCEEKYGLGGSMGWAEENDYNDLWENEDGSIEGL